MFSRCFFLLLILSVLHISCGDDEPELTNQEEILAYIADNNLDAQMTSSGLYYVINQEGDGNFPTINNSVTVTYRGYFTDGKQFDSSNGNAVTFPLTRVISGWQEGIPLFSRGGSGMLLIPSALGYGQNGSNSIPGNSVILFDVELLDF